MLLNNIELDIKTKCIETGTSQKEVAERIDVSLPYVNRITKGREQIVNKTFVKMMDELGYASSETPKTQDTLPDRYRHLSYHSIILLHHASIGCCG